MFQSSLFQFLNLEYSQPIAFAVALLSSLILTPLIRERAVKLNLLDKPGGRHIHETPVPRLGGVAIYISLVVTSLVFIALYGRYTPKGFAHFELVGILAGGTLIFLVGLLDDISPLPAVFKLFAQIMAAVVAWVCHVQVKYLVNPLFFVFQIWHKIFPDGLTFKYFINAPFFMHLPHARVFELDPILSFVITVGWLILITNALNLVDGVDGVAGGVALIAALSLWAILLDDKINQPAGALLVSTLAGATLGFLRHNYNPARIFLGDSGAYFLGFTLGASAVAGLSSNPNTATVGSVMVIAFSFPLIETLFTILRRFVKNKPVMEPDAEHIHHQILRAGFSTKGTMLVIYVTCGLLGLAACTISGADKRYFILILTTLSLAFLSGFWRREKQAGVIDASSKTTDKESVK